MEQRTDVTDAQKAKSDAHERKREDIIGIVMRGAKDAGGNSLVKGSTEASRGQSSAPQSQRPDGTGSSRA
jgi:hypothetical protein